MATGTLTRKTACQPTLGTSRPPSTGPSANPKPATVVHTASARGRSSGGNITATSDSAGGSTQAAAAPISTRAAINSPVVCDSAASTEVAPNPATPQRKTRRRPKRSAKPLPTSNIPPRQTRKPSIIHCSPPRRALRSREISGRPTLTIVESTALMNIAAQRTTRPNWRRSCRAPGS
jgi:hypothetical protein